MSSIMTFFIFIPLLISFRLRKYINHVLLLVSTVSYGNIADSLYNIGRQHLDKQEWDSTIYYANLTLQENSKNENLDISIKTHFLIAYSLSEKKEFGNSLIEYLKAAEFAEFSEEPRHKKLLISLYKNISNITKKYNHSDLTEIYISKSLKLAKEYRDTFQILGNSQNHVNLLIDMNRKKDAEILIKATLQEYPQMPADFRSHFINSLGRLKHDSAFYQESRYYYEQVLSQNNVSEKHKAVASLNYAWSYYDENNLETAIPYFINTVALCDDVEENNWLFLSYKMLGKSYTQLNKLKEALYYFSKAEGLVYSPEVDPQSYTIFNDISDFYLSQGNEKKAIEYNNLYTAELEKHIKEQENILIQDKKYNMQLLTERYFDNLEKRDLEQKANFQTRLTILISSGIILLVILGFYYRQRRMKLAIVRALTAIERTSKV